MSLAYGYTIDDSRKLLFDIFSVIKDVATVEFGLASIVACLLLGMRLYPTRAASIQGVDQTPQQVFMAMGALLMLIMLSQDLLDPDKNSLFHKRRVNPFGWNVSLPYPGLAKIEAVVKGVPPNANRNAKAFAAAASHAVRVISPFFQCPVPRSHLSESAGYERSQLGVHLYP